MADVTDTVERVDRGESHSRVTEIGAPELIDRTPHPVATGLGILLLVVVAVLAVTGLAGLVDGDDRAPEVAEVVVPRLATRTMTQAQQELERMGLIVDVRFEPNELVPPDVVVDQEPIAGARLEVGQQVVLVVSDGPVGVAVPDLAGGQAAEAERILGVLGLQISFREIYDEEVPMGEIVRSDPRAGSRAPAGATITVAVSKGPEPRTVPDVVGLPAAEAFVQIGRAELEIGRVSTRQVGADQVGTVLSVEPAPGAKVPRDQPVRVVVGSEIGHLAVPDVVGLTQDSATAAIRARELTPRVRTEAVPAGDRRAGRVISQGPVVGAPVGPGDTVTITVGVAVPPAPAPTTQPPTTQAAPPTSRP